MGGEIRSLKNCVAVVAGASCGAGRGISLALGDAGATVYVTGGTTCGGPKARDGALSSEGVQKVAKHFGNGGRHGGNRAEAGAARTD